MIPRSIRPIFGRVHGCLSGAIEFVLGGDSSPVPSPERLRNEYLVGFLLIVLPVVFVSVLIDFRLGFDAFTWARIGIFVLLVVVFPLMRSGFADAGIDLLFFGGVLIVSAGWLGSASDPLLSAELFTLINLIDFGAILLYGVYAKSVRRIHTLFALTLTTYALGYAFVRGVERNPFNVRLGLFALHSIAFGLAHFLRRYYKRIAEIAEARKVMIRGLEDLVAEARATGTARLESFSHDIRSPITGILGVHDLLASTNLDTEQMSYLNILEKSNRLLLEIVESILDPGAVAHSLGRNSMQELLDDVLAPYGATARSKGVSLRLRAIGDPPFPPITRADAARIIGNLVDNALKYTDAGTISVVARKPLDFSGVDVTVTDTGAGMSRERLDAVRSGAAGADKGVAGSRGLGLAGVRRLVENAGGVMLVDSEAGRGTRVTIRFPLPEERP